MKSQEQKAKLAQVKLAMAARYEQRARLSGSKPRRDRYMRHAETYRRQAETLQR